MSFQRSTSPVSKQRSPPRGLLAILTTRSSESTRTALPSRSRALSQGLRRTKQPQPAASPAVPKVEAQPGSLLGQKGSDHRRRGTAGVRE